MRYLSLHYTILDVRPCLHAFCIEMPAANGEVLVVLFYLGFYDTIINNTNKKRCINKKGRRVYFFSLMIISRLFVYYHKESNKTKSLLGPCAKLENFKN